LALRRLDLDDEEWLGECFGCRLWETRSDLQENLEVFSKKDQITPFVASHPVIRLGTNLQVTLRTMV